MRTYCKPSQKGKFEYTLLLYSLVQETDSPLRYDWLVQTLLPCSRCVFYFSLGHRRGRVSVSGRVKGFFLLPSHQ